MADLLSYDENADKAYQHQGISSSILDSFTTPYDKVRGMAWDGSNFIGADYGTDKIYLHTGFTPSVSNSFSSPSLYCYGLAFDGINLLSGDWGNDTIYKHDGISSSILETCSGVGTSDITDLEWDGTNILHCGWTSDKVFKHDGFSSSILDSFSLLDTLPKGIAWDGENLVSAGSGSDWIWKHDGFSSSILDSFASPGSSPSALTFKVAANTAPTAPTALLCEGESDPPNVIDMTPEFSAVFNDPDEGDIADAVEIHVATTEGGLGAPDLWDSGWLAISVINGNRSADIEYAGSDLAINQTYYWKIRFRDDGSAAGAWSSVASFATAWFENWQEKQTLSPQRRFVYDDIVETERVESFGVISRASDAIISGGTSLVLINTDKYWNKFITDKSNLRRVAKLQLGIGVLNTIARSGVARSGITASNLVSLAPGSVISSGIYLVGQGQWQDVFTGWADDPEFSEALVTLSLRDKFAGLGERELGSEESPLDYYSAAYNPADLAWSILVTHGGLDSPASPANTDIDYNTWLAWKTACSGVNLSLKARFTGQSIREAIELIRDLTNSDIYVGGDGKIKFFRFLPSAVPGGAYHFNEDRFDEISVRLDSDKIINYVKVYYGYDPSTETWAGNYLAQDLDSQQNPPDGYGLSSETIDSTIVWHATSASAATYAERRVVAFGQPLEVVSFRSFMMGMTTEIGNIIRLTYSFLDYLSDYFRVHKIAALDLADGTIRLEAGFFQDFTFVVLDLMEYSSNALAQAAWVSDLSPSPTPQLWSRLESPAHVVTPEMGVGGDVAGNPGWSPHKFGNGYFGNPGIGVRFPTVANNINTNKGTIEFWHRLVIVPPQMDEDKYLFSCRRFSPAGGIYCAWLLAGYTLYVQTPGPLILIWNWEFDRNIIYHFGITWDREGNDIGGGKTLILKVDNVEIGSSTDTWAASPNINPYIYLSTDHDYQHSLYGGMDNFKTYDICKTDFSDRHVEDPNELQCYSEPSIRQQGSYSLKIFAQATLSLNGTLTRIVSPTIDLSNLVEIQFAVRASRTGSNFKIAIRDSGSTITEYTPNILVANTWQTEKWSILGLSDQDKDAIDRIQITITNADADNTIYIDKIQAFA